MGLTCTEIPSPTSVPVGHNGGILQRTPPAAFTEMLQQPRQDVRAGSLQSAKRHLRRQLLFLPTILAESTWKIDVSFTCCGTGQPGELFKISDPTSTDV